MKRTYIHLKTISKVNLLTCFLFVFCVIGCSKEDGPMAQVKSTEKKVTSFVFLLTNNPIDINVVATIDETSKTITATMPRGTNVKGLLPEIKISAKATIDFDSARDFTNPVEYTITAEDGTKATYTVTIIAPLSDRQVLQAIIDANPGNTLGWDVENIVDLDLLDGVYYVNGHIVELEINTKNINVLPKEIGELKYLELLFMAGNPIAMLPSEIGDLTSLTNLTLTNNQLISVPKKIGQLSKLEKLILYNNKLTSIPSEIGQLIALKEMNLGMNELTFLPKEIGKLDSLRFLYSEINQLTSLPVEIGELINLEIVVLEDNKLSSIPIEMGLLTKMSVLNLKQNNLINVPQSVCDLRTFNGGILRLLTDLGVGCNPTYSEALTSWANVKVFGY